MLVNEIILYYVSRSKKLQIQLTSRAVQKNAGRRNNSSEWKVANRSKDGRIRKSILFVIIISLPFYFVLYYIFQYNVFTL